jgi:long-chain acyl-CoA synthetase
LQYTGGTTGVSKGAMLTHANLLGAIEQTSRLLMEEGTEPPPGSKAVAVAPFFHIFGFAMVLLLGLRRGWNLLCVPRFEPAGMLELIARETPAALAGVAPIFAALAGHPAADSAGLDRVSLYISGGAPVPEALMAAFHSRFGRDIWEGYGMSEAAPLAINTYLRGPRPGTVGVPIPGTDVRTVDLDTGTSDVPAGEPGELVVRGPQVMLGYWNMPEETKLALRDGWLHTGDIAVIDDEGFISIVDRKKDMINAAGFKVYPREVEEVLYMHPDVLEAVVIGVPDDYRGETVKAFVVPKHGGQLNAEDLTEHCRRELAAYKVPRLFEFRDELPKSAVGKLLRRLLAEEQAATVSGSQLS